MSRVISLLPLLLTACNDEKGPTPKPWNGGKPFTVPDVADTGLLVTIAVLVILCGVVVRRLMKPRN